MLWTCASNGERWNDASPYERALHSGSLCCFDAERAVLHHQAAFGRDAELARGEQEHLGLGLAERHVFLAHHDREQVAYLRHGQAALDVMAPAARSNAELRARAFAKSN